MEQGTQGPTPSGNARLQQLFTNLLKVFGALVVILVIVYSFGQRTASVKVTPASELRVASAEASVRANPNDVAARISLADAYLRDGRSDDALDQLNEILRADPENRSALMGVATILSDRGDNEGAKENLQKFVANSGKGEFATEDTQLERAYFMLGTIAKQEGDSGSAVAYFKKALQINGGDADAWYELGLALNEMKGYEDAAASFNAALSFVPAGWCEPYDGLAVAYEGAKNASGATYASAMSRICNGGGLSDAASLEPLVKGPLRVPALLGLGLAAENDHANDKALAYYKQVTAIDPTNVAAVNGIARLNANTTPTT